MAAGLNEPMRSTSSDAISGELNNGTLQIRSGSKPADPDDAATGTLLAEISLPADAFTEDGAGVISLNGSWSDSDANASGTAGWARFIGSSSPAQTIDCTVTATGGGGDIELDDTSIIQGGTVTISSLTITMLAS